MRDLHEGSSEYERRSDARGRSHRVLPDNLRLTDERTQALERMTTRGPVPVLSNLPSDVINSRMRCFYLSYPLQQLISNAESEHHKEWQGLNFAYLVLTVIDCVVAKMAPGSTRGATRTDVVQELRKSICAFRPDAEESLIGEIADFIVESLIGKDEFHEFQIVAQRADRLVCEPFRVRLIRRTWSEDLNAPVYTAEPQAIQLVLSMLDTPTMDAQKANMVILEEHVKRGRLDAALESAQRDVLLTRQFEAEITSLIRAVQRDINLVNYTTNVKPMLDEAHDHAKRVGSDRNRIIRDLADQQMKHMDREGAIPFEVTQLKNRLEQLQSHHTRLTTTILQAGESFLIEQNIQRFRVLAGISVVNLAERALYPALMLSIETLSAHWTEFAELCLGCEIRRVVDHGLIIDKLLVDRVLEEYVDEDALELLDIETVARTLTPELEIRFRRILLDSIDEMGTRLSLLLNVGREHKLNQKELYLLALTVLRGLHPIGMPDYLIENDGAQLDDPDVAGDDLIVFRRAQRNSMSAVNYGSQESSEIDHE